MEQKGCLPKKYSLPALEFCDLGIGYRCNFRCVMCRFWEDSPLYEGNVLSGAEWERVLREIAALERAQGCMVNFAGPGESLLRKDIWQLIRCGRALQLNIQIITNGYLIDAVLARAMREADLGYLCLSLDSINPRTHDFLRGVPGAFDRVIEAITAVAECSPRTKIGINTVISKANMADILALARWCEHNEHIAYMNLQAVTQPFSFHQGPDEQWFIREQNRFLWPDDERLVHETMDALIRCKQAGYKIADSIAQLNAFRAYFLHPERFIRDNRCNLAQGNILIIDPPGNVSLCSLVGIIGSVKQGSPLGEIMAAPEMSAHRKKIQECRRNCHLVVSCYFEG
jgi:MoaA/NifB/PqqE/SkfB family radical SAM enzyme